MTIDNRVHPIWFPQHINEHYVWSLQLQQIRSGAIQLSNQNDGTKSIDGIKVSQPIDSTRIQLELITMSVLCLQIGGPSVNGDGLDSIEYTAKTHELQTIIEKQVSTIDDHSIAVLTSTQFTSPSK